MISDRQIGEVSKNSLGMEFMNLPSGNFMMGSDDKDISLACLLTKNTQDCKNWAKDEKPKHSVNIGADILIMRFELRGNSTAVAEHHGNFNQTTTR